jgi:endonuclease/exonuclease/phosphatase family metal-dependent hydrolase
MNRLLFLALIIVLIAPAWAQPALNVATWNLRLNLASDGPNAWPQRREMAKALIRFHEFDLFGTQEGLIGQIEDLEAMEGYGRVGSGRDDGARAGEHSAIFYRKDRLQLEAHGDFWFSPTPDRPSKGWDARCCNRLATWARFRLREGGRPLTVFSVHFDHEGTEARRESAKLLLRKAGELAGDGWLVCLGDFNATPDSEPAQIMAAALGDAFRLSASPPYGPIGTFNDFKPELPALDRIDYVFVGPRIRVQRYGVLTDSIAGRVPSDHFPLLTRLAFE